MTRLAGVASAAFAAAVSLDLATKAVVVVLGGVSIYNRAPSQLAERFGVMAATFVVTALLTRLGEWRGTGRPVGAWVAVGVLAGGTVGNGVSGFLWSRGVPDFVPMGGGWEWNLADFEIVLGLLGTVASFAVTAIAAWLQSRRTPPAAAPARTRA